jgi:condensin-2 complex subunit G2
LLNDDDVRVRALMVEGTCRVLATFWELIPPVVSKNLLNKLLQLAFDASAAGVRVSVCSGLAYLLAAQPLAHGALGKVLPQLAEPLLHDQSDAVRGRWVSLLSTVATLRTIRLFDVANADQLLLRLSVESAPAVARQLTRLLVPSFAPTDKAPTERLTRAVALMRQSVGAAHAFFANV